MVYQCQKTQAVNLHQERLGHSPALGQGSMMLGMRLYFISTNKQIIMRKVVGHAKSFTVYHSRNVVNQSSIRPLSNILKYCVYHSITFIIYQQFFEHLAQTVGLNTNIYTQGF